MRLVYTAVALIAMTSVALADGSTTYSVLGSDGSTVIPFNANKDANNNFSPNIGGFDTGSSVTATATPANSSHAAGTSVGGLFSLPMARVNGGSGTITTVNIISAGGFASLYQVRIWDKNPASTTCADNSAFVSNATDDAHLISQPFTMQMSPPVVNTGDATKTYSTTGGLSLSYKNQDGSPGKNVYVCILASATDTADQNAVVRINLAGTQN